MPYDIVCDDCDFHKVEHRLDAARERKSAHEADASNHDIVIEEFRMNGTRGTNPVHRR